MIQHVVLVAFQVLKSLIPPRADFSRFAQLRKHLDHQHATHSGSNVPWYSDQCARNSLEAAFQGLRSNVFQHKASDVYVEGRKNLDHTHAYQHTIHINMSKLVSKAAIIDRDKRLNDKAIEVFKAHEAGHSRLEFAHLRDLLPKHAARPQQVILEDGATAKTPSERRSRWQRFFRKSFAVLLRNTMMLVSNAFSDKLETLPA